MEDARKWWRGLGRVDLRNEIDIFMAYYVRSAWGRGGDKATELVCSAGIFSQGQN